MEVILDMIRSASENSANKMYGEGDRPVEHTLWASKSVFQALSQLARVFVMRLIFVDIPFTSEIMMKWVLDAHTDVAEDAIDELRNLKILIESHPNGDGATSTPGKKQFRLNAYFKRSIFHSITNPCQPWGESEVHISTESSVVGKRKLEVKANPSSLTLTVSRSSIAPTPVSLDQFCHQRWDTLLRLLVGAPLEDSNPANNIASELVTDEKSNYVEFITKFLKAARLATEEEDSWKCTKLMITSQGYEFMLKDFLSQVWVFVHAELHQSKEQYDALNFLFMLSFCEVGKGYLIDALSSTQKQMMYEFSLVGLVYFPSMKSNYFYPTRASVDVLFRGARNAIATTTNSNRKFTSREGFSQDMAELLTSSLSNGVASSSSQHSLQNLHSFSSMKIIVETNNQVVAYLNSDLHFAMISLFVDVSLRLPNVIMGRITRDKAKKAYKVGIKSSQIIDFLQSHAHPIVAKNAFVVPENVSDLLRVWENEVYRISCHECVLFALADVRGLTTKHFHDIVAHMARLGMLLWSNEANRLIGVAAAGASQLQAFASEELGLFHLSY